MRFSQFYVLLSMILIAPHVDKIVAQGLTIFVLVMSAIAFFKEIKS